ncbi:MAG: serine hydrolase [Pedococcus sp.]
MTAATERYLSNILSPATSNVRAVLVTLDRYPLVQLYRSSTPAQSHDVHSVTKSVVATLVGIALSEGRLHSLDDTLATLLPEHAGDMNPTVSAITLRQLLTMTAGLPPDLPNGDPPASLSGPDWVAHILQTGTVAPPGKAFAYSSAGSHLLSAILTHAVGTSALDYARPRLFQPLGIDTRNAFEPSIEDEAAIAAYDKANFAWPKDPTGIQIGFGTLKIAPRDLAKLGQLYLDGGQWNGLQLVSAAWVKESTTAQVATQGTSFAFSENYGYQWWVTKEKGHGAYAAVGFAGQLVEVVPDLRLVVVTATEAGENNLRFEHLRGMIADAILPAVGG